jgi:hypothetical protein
VTIERFQEILLKKSNNSKWPILPSDISQPIALAFFSEGEFLWNSLCRGKRLV